MPGCRVSAGAPNGCNTPAGPCARAGQHPWSAAPASDHITDGLNHSGGANAYVGQPASAQSPHQSSGLGASPVDWPGLGPQSRGTGRRIFRRPQRMISKGRNTAGTHPGAAHSTPPLLAPTCTHSPAGVRPKEFQHTAHLVPSALQVWQGPRVRSSRPSGFSTHLPAAAAAQKGRQGGRVVSDGVLAAAAGSGASSAWRVGGAAAVLCGAAAALPPGLLRAGPPLQQAPPGLRYIACSQLRAVLVYERARASCPVRHCQCPKAKRRRT